MYSIFYYSRLTDLVHATSPAAGHKTLPRNRNILRGKNDVLFRCLYAPKWVFQRTLPALKNNDFFLLSGLFLIEVFSVRSQVKEKITVIFFQKKTEKRKLSSQAGRWFCQGFPTKNFLQ